MNSVKNAIVTMTLLAVGYGAYVVLSNPVPDDLGELADGTVWDPPEVSTPLSPMGDGVELSIDAPPPLATTGPSTCAATESSQLIESNAASAISPSVDNQPTTDDLADPLSGPPITDGLAASDGPALSFPSNDPTPAQYSDTNSYNAEEDSDTNYYVSQSDTTSVDSSYPSTSAPQVPPVHELPVGRLSVDTQTATTSVSAFDSAWQDVQGELRGGQLGGALAALSIWYNDPALTSVEAERLTTLLDQLAGTVIYSRDSFLDPAHVVQQGETIEQLARQYEVPVEFLARINGISAPFEVFPGESLKVIRGPFRAEISRSSGQLTLFLGRHYAGRFQTRLGDELPAQGTVYDVAAIEPGLEYFDNRSGERVGRDDPNNPYGPVWIGLRGEQVTTAHNVGIHVDRGHPTRCCIAVSDADANDLAAILGPGSTVEIRP